MVLILEILTKICLFCHRALQRRLSHVIGENSADPSGYTVNWACAVSRDLRIGVPKYHTSSVWTSNYLLAITHSHARIKNKATLGITG